MTQNLSTMTPVEIDTELARLWGEIQTKQHYLHSEHDYLVRCTAGTANDWRREECEKAIEAYKAKIAELQAEAAPFEAEFKARGGWLRYFLVTNQSGHVHRGMGCTTCFETTQYAWVVELADCDEAKMVEEFGEKACTVCFPDAPANPSFHGPGRRDAAAKAERQAEKDAKAAAKAAKAINAEGFLKVPAGSHIDHVTGETRQYFDTVRTKVAARNALSAAVQSYGYYGPTHPHRFQDAISVLTEALEGTEIDTAKVIDTAAKKALRDGGTYDYRKVMSDA